MAKTTKSLLQLLLKIVNSMLGIVGIAMIMYSIWMVWVSQKDNDGSWFIQAFLAIGIILCAITCLGYVAANTANAGYLTLYMLTISVVLLVEIGISADIFLNSDWENDFPEDPTGMFDGFKDFVESNIDTCKLIGLLFILAQVCSALLAVALKAIKPDEYRNYYVYNSDYEENAPSRLSLLHQNKNDVNLSFPSEKVYQ